MSAGGKDFERPPLAWKCFRWLAAEMLCRKILFSVRYHAEPSDEPDFPDDGILWGNENMRDPPPPALDARSEDYDTCSDGAEEVASVGNAARTGRTGAVSHRCGSAYASA